MNQFQQDLTRLFYLIVYADEEFTVNEKKMGKLMCEYEQIPHSEFEEFLSEISGRDTQKIYDETLESLLKASDDDKVRAVAWLSNIANVDGFMDKREWNIIYQLYKKDLGIELSEVMEKQKELPRHVLDL